MTLADELYQEVILDHNRRPRNFEPIPDAEFEAEGYNPLCGDRVSVAMDFDEGRISAIGFQGQGCAISTAAASIMTEALKGRTPEQVRELFQLFLAMVRGDEDVSWPEDLETLEVFSGLTQYPMRVKCATLAWHTAVAALEGRQEAVSTE